MEGNLREAKNRLAFLGAMVGSLAHELKNPLSTLRLNLELLAEDLAEPDSPREARVLRKLELMQSETRRLETILDDFLRYARPVRLQPEPTALTGLIDDVLDLMEPQLAESGIRLHRHYAARGELYPVDRDYFKIAILNLLVNAEHAMGEVGGGELIVRVDRHDDAFVIHVIDTGPGIRPDHLPRVFEVYYSTKRNGTGMGLAHARRVVEDHGGTLTVETEVGKGTDFKIALPWPPPATDR